MSQYFKISFFQAYKVMVYYNAVATKNLHIVDRMPNVQCYKITLHFKEYKERALG